MQKFFIDALLFVYARVIARGEIIYTVIPEKFFNKKGGRRFLPAPAALRYLIFVSAEYPKLGDIGVSFGFGGGCHLAVVFRIAHFNGKLESAFHRGKFGGNIGYVCV